MEKEMQWMLGINSWIMHQYSATSFVLSTCTQRPMKITELVIHTQPTTPIDMDKIPTVTGIYNGNISILASIDSISAAAFKNGIKFPTPFDVLPGQRLSVNLEIWAPPINSVVVSGYFIGTEQYKVDKDRFAHCTYKKTECPFCGSQEVGPTKTEDSHIDRHQWAILCAECFATGPEKGNVDAAWNAWNEAFED